MMLSQGERVSDVWVKIRKHYDERLTELRARNDNLMNEQERGQLIGQIKEVKLLLEMDKDEVFAK